MSKQFLFYSGFCYACKHNDMCKDSKNIGLVDCSSSDLACVQILNEKKDWLYLGCDQPDIPSNAVPRHKDSSLPKECTRRTLTSESQNNNTGSLRTILMCFCNTDKCNGKNMLTGVKITGIK